MSFKKLNASLKETLLQLEMEKPTPFQKKILPKIKSGSNVFGIAPAGAGKTTALIIGTVQKLGAEAFQDAPRALIFVKDKEAALELEERFNQFIKNTSLRIYAAFDEPNIETQKNDIYEGVDIVISTPNKLKKLFKISGINLNELKLLAVEDANFLVKSRDYNDLITIPEHVTKCQFLVFAESFDGKVEKLQDSFMSHSEIVFEKQQEFLQYLVGDLKFEPLQLRKISVPPVLELQEKFADESLEGKLLLFISSVVEILNKT